MKKDLAEIICVVDRSGSMESIRDDAIGSFNTFLDEQQKLPGECLFTYVHFDHEYELVFGGRKIKDVAKLTRDTFQPRGSTALLDAIGRTIVEVGSRFAAMPEAERPERVLMVIVTDGGENSSRTFTREAINEKIKHQGEVYKWNFIFLAAGPDAFAEANAIGIAPSNIASYTAGDSTAHHYNLHRSSVAAKNYRAGGQSILPAEGQE